MKSFLGTFLWRLWFPCLIIFLWQVALAHSHNPFFPPPSKIFDDVGFVVTPHWIGTSVKSSLYVLTAGYLIGSAMGILFGAIIGSSRMLIDVTTPIANFIRSIPSAAKVPVMMAILGIGTATRVCAISVAVLFPVLMATMRSVAATDQHLLELGHLMEYGRFRSLVLIRVPAATGDILTGLHAAVQVALLVMVVSEMLGSGVGIGAFVVRSQNSFMISDMWVGIFVIGVIGILLNEIFVFAERKFAPWYFHSKGVM
jgi:ABC-type nitrate/sulfonate/bicarbonate transport system permease component